jgi:hypothetical protein
VAANAKITNGKLDVIHELVNSNMSAAMQSELDALEVTLAALTEVVDLKRAAGREPGPEALAAIRSTEGKIRESRAALNDRLMQSEKIAARREGGE